MPPALNGGLRASKRSTTIVERDVFLLLVDGYFGVKALFVLVAAWNLWSQNPCAERSTHLLCVWRRDSVLWNRSGSNSDRAQPLTSSSPRSARKWSRSGAVSRLDAGGRV